VAMKVRNAIALTALVGIVMYLFRSDVLVLLSKLTS